MTLNNFNFTKSNGYSALQILAEGIGEVRISDLLTDPERIDKYTLSCLGVTLDYSKNLVTNEVLDGLLALAEESLLVATREKMFRGEAINSSEQRPVLHTALRAKRQSLIDDNLSELAANIAEQRARVQVVSEKIRNGQWLGSTGKPITDVINLGIGGSDLGPKLVCEALKSFHHEDIRCHFVSNVDGEVIHSCLATLNPETTLIIISSKTFTTQETLLNATTAANWLREHLDLDNPFASRHFIGVTASPQNAIKLGLPESQLLKFWDWVGGRYSLWSSIGLSIAISVGYDNFEALLEGAEAMDDHFRHKPLSENMPVILALLGIWYSNFLDGESQAVIPYCERLCHFPFYLQQLDMESNGKGVTLDGRSVDYSTGPVIWGLTGTNGQHSFFQLLHQGTHLIPVDFIGVINDEMSSPDHHRVLLANMLAQSAALMAGKQDVELPAYQFYPGNRPSNVMLLDQLTPQNLGALIALYEHKVFVQGCIWNVNSFDQWGVELGKVLASGLLSESRDDSYLDLSTRALLAKIEQPKDSG